MIGIDGLRPPGQICYGYLGTFRFLVLSIRYLGIALVLLPPHIGSWFLVCLGECQLKFSESGDVVKVFARQTFWSMCGGESFSSFCWENGSSKFFSTPMGPSYVGKSLCQTGKFFFQTFQWIWLLQTYIFFFRSWVLHWENCNMTLVLAKAATTCKKQPPVLF